MKNKKYLFYLHSLDLTGGVKVTLDVIKELSERGYNVDILVDKNVIKYDIPDQVKVYKISLFNIKNVIHIENTVGEDTNNIKKSLFKPIKLKILEINIFKKLLIYIRYIFFLICYPVYFFTIRSFLQKHSYDNIVFTNMYKNLEYLFAFHHQKKIIVLHNSPNNVYKERITPHLLPIKYYFKNMLCIGVSSNIIKEMQCFVDSSTELRTIYNPFDMQLIQQLANEEIEQEFNNKQYFVIVGGLNDRKRVDRAINAFNKLNRKDIYLLVIGKGVELDNLRNLVDNLNLIDNIIFLGAKKNPYKYISKAKGLLLTSDSEGLPTVLIESLICYTPVISTNCPTGPSEILIDELEKFLVKINNRQEEEIIIDIKNKMSFLLEQDVTINYDNLNRFKKENIITKWQEI